MVNLLEKLDNQLNKELESCQNLSDLNKVKILYFGKSGLITNEFKQLPLLEPSLKIQIATELNLIKEKYLLRIHHMKEKFEKQNFDKILPNDFVDLTLNSKKVTKGKLHPISKVLYEISAIFENIGFSLTEGPNIEDDFHNFEALNFSKNHPARAMHDTFYLKNGDLLRTHTSSVQIRWMEKNKLPPYKLISYGRTYRRDFDSTHTPMFHQIEGLVIDQEVNMADLKTCVNYFLQKFFEIENLPLRLRPSFFPFTEPSAEVDIGCIKENGEITIGSGKQWLEVLGCGMVHPNVLSNVGIDPKKYRGFAFGMGVERLAMLKYGISDLREFFINDKRWLDHFGFSLTKFF